MCVLLLFSAKLYYLCPAFDERSDARVAEEARLESVYTSKAYPEFESRSLRKKRTTNCRPFFVLQGFGDLLEGVFQAQNGDGLVEVLNDLETLLAEEVEPVLDAVFGTHTHVGTATAHIAVTEDAGVVLVVGIGEAQQRVDSK